jgi:hypothetical protein
LVAKQQHFHAPDLLFKSTEQKKKERKKKKRKQKKKQKKRKRKENNDRQLTFSQHLSSRGSCTSEPTSRRLPLDLQPILDSGPLLSSQFQLHLAIP